MRIIWINLQAARRELERQRQLELVRQKRQELEAQRIREQGEVSHLKAKSKTLACEIESLVRSHNIFRFWMCPVCNTEIFTIMECSFKLLYTGL